VATEDDGGQRWTTVHSYTNLRLKI